MTAKDFALQLDAEWAAQQDDLNDWVIMIATDALAGVVEKSPVDVGTFQNNWLVSIGSAAAETIDFPGSFLGENGTVIASYAASEGFPMIYLQNNLPYAGKLDDGYSNQAPQGMIALTIVEIEVKYDGMVL